MNKIATTIEQSNKLIELGLSADTADMWWVKHYLIAKNQELDKPSNDEIKDVFPAWSLSRLLELMPFSSLHNFFNNKWRCDIHYEDGDVRKFGEDADSPLDAAFEMVCYLLENRLVK